MERERESERERERETRGYKPLELDASGWRQEASEWTCPLSTRGRKREAPWRRIKTSVSRMNRPTFMPTENGSRHGQNLALTGLCVPNSGHHAHGRRDKNQPELWARLLKPRKDQKGLLCIVLDSFLDRLDLLASNHFVRFEQPRQLLGACV